jgi:hypothetical protein
MQSFFCAGRMPALRKKPDHEVGIPPIQVREVTKPQNPKPDPILLIHSSPIFWSLTRNTENSKSLGKL